MDDPIGLIGCFLWAVIAILAFVITYLIAGVIWIALIIVIVALISLEILKWSYKKIINLFREKNE